MLNIIEPRDHSVYQEKVESLLGLLKVYQGFSLSLRAQNQATFIIAEDEARGIYGGLFFTLKLSETFMSFFQRNFCNFFQKTQKCGAAAFIFVQMKKRR